MQRQNQQVNRRHIKITYLRPRSLHGAKTDRTYPYNPKAHTGPRRVPQIPSVQDDLKQTEPGNMLIISCARGCWLNGAMHY